MLDLQHLASSTKADVQVFTGDGSGATRSWLKPRGVSMVYMLALGPGAPGGNGAVGAASAAAGGGGGSSGAQVTLLIPAIFIPDALNVIVPAVGSGTDTRIAVPAVTLTDNMVLLRAAVGNAGGNASGATPGTAGPATGTATIATFPLAGMGRYNSLAGQPGTAGGTSAANATAQSLPTTGLVVLGGTGGGGLGTGTGSNGGTINGGGVFPAQLGTLASTSPTVPGTAGTSGFQPIPGLTYWYSGIGGGASRSDATGAGLFGGNGGTGAYGCGGGGGGGVLTGGTAGVGGAGGPGLVIIISW